MKQSIITAIVMSILCHISIAVDVRLVDLDPPEAQQQIDSHDTTLHYAPKVDSNVPATRVLGNEPTQVLEDIYLANQYHGQDGLGGYLYGYSVPDIAKTERKHAGGDLRGAYNYISGDGKEIKVEYWDDGTGFHQTDNVPLIQPQQISDTPEVQAAKEEHARIWAEQAERNSHPIEDPNANYRPGQVTSKLPQQNNYQGQISHNSDAYQQLPNNQFGQVQQKTYQTQSSGNQQTPGNYGQANAHYGGGVPQQGAAGQQQNVGQSGPSQQQYRVPQQGPTGQQQFGEQQRSGGAHQQGTVNQQHVTAGHQKYNSGILQPGAAQQQQQQQRPAPGQQNYGGGQYDAAGSQQGSAGQQYAGAGQPPQYGGQQKLEQRNVQYSGQHTQLHNTYASSSGNGGNLGNSEYKSNPNEDNGEYKAGSDEEQGPPKGFWYNFDYPVGIIVSKQGGASSGGNQQPQYKRAANLGDLYEENKKLFESQLKIGSSGGTGGSYQKFL